MATRTIGTNANNTLVAIVYPYLTSAVVANDFGAINALIRDDEPQLFTVNNPGTAAGGNAVQAAAFHALIPNSLGREGLLHVPNRGVLKVYPGDWIAVDASGWPILVAGNAVAGTITDWTHSGNIT